MPELHRVTRFGAVNAYLVQEPDGLTLIDTLISRSAPLLVSRAAATGAPIVRVVLTHGHSDHAGSVDALREQLPDAEFLVSAREARLISGDRSLDAGEGTKLRGSWHKVSTRPTLTLAPGDRVGSLEAVDARGHSPGQLAFLDTRDGTLYCGDAFTTLGGVKTTSRPRLPFPVAALATWNRPLALETARALRGLDPARLAPGHGPVVEAPGVEMDAAIKAG